MLNLPQFVVILNKTKSGRGSQKSQDLPVRRKLNFEQILRDVLIQVPNIDSVLFLIWISQVYLHYLLVIYLLNDGEIQNFFD
jgi:hypothetical protein